MSNTATAVATKPAVTNHGVELRKIKYAAFASQETNCFTADIYLHGKKIGDVENDGHGGNDFINPRECQTILEGICKTMPAVECYGTSLPMSPDLLLGNLMQDWLMLREDKRITRKQTCFRLKDATYEEGAWMVMRRTPFTPAVKAHLVAKYGDNLGEILNETVAARS